MTRGRRDARSFANKGGRFFCEVQASGGVPLQASYDALFGPGEVTVTNEGSVDEIGGEVVCVAPRASGHPLLKHLPTTVRTQYKSQGELVLPLFDKGLMSPFAAHPANLYWGWFSDWAEGWLPLLHTPPVGPEGKQFPVLLAKQVGHGEVIATTMRIGSSGFQTLIRNVLTVEHAGVQNFYRRARWRIRGVRVVQGAGIWLAVFLVAAWLTCLVLRDNPTPSVMDLVNLAFGPALVAIALEALPALQGELA